MSVAFGPLLVPLSRKLYALDFDLTVLKIHSFREGVEVDKVGDRAFSDIADINFFFAFAGAILARGAKLAIVSFGQKQVICEYLKHLLPNLHKEVLVFTPQDAGGMDGRKLKDGKNTLLRLACAAAGTELSPQTTCFVDDDAQNCKLAKNLATALVCPSGGLTADNWIALTQHLPDPLDQKSLNRIWESSIVPRNSIAHTLDLKRKYVAQELQWKDQDTSMVLYYFATDTSCTVGTIMNLEDRKKPLWRWQITVPNKLVLALALFFVDPRNYTLSQSVILNSRLLAAQIFY